MKATLSLSHGPLAKGMYETTQWFMGENIDQYDYLCLEQTEQPEKFDLRIKEKLKDIDKGDGAILITDIKSGTPCNRCIPLASNDITVLCGMNLALVLELLGRRLSNDYNFDELVNISKEGICNLNDILNNIDNSECLSSLD